MHVSRLVAAATAAGLTAFGLAAAAPALGQALGHRSTVVNPYSPAYHHPYRHGFVPTIGRLKLMLAWDRARGIHPDSSANVDYGGGIDGIGVTTGSEKVYLVFSTAHNGEPRASTARAMSPSQATRPVRHLTSRSS